MAPNDIDSDLTDLETFWLCDQTQIKRCCEDSLTMFVEAGKWKQVSGQRDYLRVHVFREDTMVWRVFTTFSATS